MFTGIVESTGIVIDIIQQGTNYTYWIESPLSKELKVDQSLSHSGVCLTVEEIRNTAHRVTAIEETLNKTSLQSWKKGTVVNLERCLPMNGRLDGHFVQGHVDTTGTCISRENRDGSWEFRFSFPEEFAALVIEKGSISMNGISLTIFNITRTEFTVAIIPYTFEHTNIRDIHPGDLVNLEFDVIGKYLLRKMEVS
jgi:riboflavin synthase